MCFTLRACEQMHFVILQSVGVQRWTWIALGWVGPKNMLTDEDCVTSNTCCGMERQGEDCDFRSVRSYVCLYINNVMLLVW